MTKEQRASGMLLGAFVGDAISLGAHWLYDRNDIVAKFGRVSGFADPASSYHVGKKAGDFTHLGDQMLVLQQSIVTHGGLFDAEDFMASWRAFWLTPGNQSYRDKATRTVLANLADGQVSTEAGAPSSELAGPARGMPVLATGVRHGYDENELIAALKLQTRITHKSPEVLDTCAFLGRLVSGLDAGLDLETSLDGSLGDSSQFIRDVGGKAESPRIDKLSTGDAIESLGQACDLVQALPATILVLRRHADSFEEAMIENVMAGGDSATRGIIIGGILGYMLGVDAIPTAWRNGLNQVIPGLS